jgi:beta-galactosidase
MNFLRTLVILSTFFVALFWSPMHALASDPTVENNASPIQLIASGSGDILLNQGWDYYETPQQNPSLLNRTDGSIRVDLPHTWNATDPTDTQPGYRRDASWYRKQLQISPGAKDGRYLLYFESANMTADVYVNGQRAGGHVGGYLGFEIDITGHLDTKGINEILVRVDNGIDRQIIPSQKSDFVLYGGLTRDVFLRVRPQNYIASLQIDTPAVSAQKATVLATVSVQQHAVAGAPMQLELQVYRQGDVVVRAEANLEPGNGPGSVQVKLPEIENPALWSPDTPNLYELAVTLKGENGEVLHQASERFGLRWFGFADNGSFELNGERLLLRGTHRHEEFAGFGAAMPNELHVRDMQMIKDVGANFVRLGHYPQDPIVYKAADELGLIIWDELPWCRGGLGDEVWKNNTESMLREMISQNRNHASVFFWSLGNEIYWEPDFEGGGDELALNEYLRHLNDIAHEMDPSRLTSIRKYYAGSDIVDVFSPSIWAGWYGGGYHQYEEALLDAQKKYPALLHMEYGGSSHVGRSNNNPPGGDGLQGGQLSVTEMVNQSGVVSVAKYGDWSESYIVDLFDWHLKVSESLPDFAGNAQWAFKDFATPLRPENALPYINQKGLVDRQGQPKEAYWVFKSYWTKDPSFCHIYGHSWTERHGEKGTTQRVRAYCNTGSAQLTLNGIVLGEKIKDPDVFPAQGLFWDVKFKPGLNRLKVTGKSPTGVLVSDELEIEYSEDEFGKLADIQLSSKQLGNGLILIEALAVDKNGKRVHSSSERVYFSHVNRGTGGMLLESFGTPERSSVIELANGRAAILFEPSNDGGKAVIEVRSQTFKGKTLIVP